jgi:hypothetical protein
MRHFTLLFSLLIYLSASLFGQEKRALLIGVGDYPPELGWSSLNAANDVEYLKNVLPLHGFKPANTITLLNEKATKAGIEKTMEELINSSKKGDIILIHFSGHGQQITDDNDDEADGLDEAWVPVDAQGRYSPTDRPSAPAYKGENHIRDDQVGKWVETLSQIVGKDGSVVVSIDACHSGTATRSSSLGAVRGDPEPFNVPIPGKKRDIIKLGPTKDKDFIGGAAMEKGNVVTFSASSPTQINRETIDANNKGVGSLSYAFAKALSELPSSATYGDIFLQIKAMIQTWIPSQFPMMEGAANQQVFSGKFTAAPEVNYVDRWAGDTAVTIKMGTLQQISPGAIFELFDPQTGNTVANATATKVSLVETLASVDTKIDNKKPWAIRVKSLPMAPYKLLVGYDSAQLPKAWIPQLDQAIKSYGFAELSNQPECWITFAKDTGLIVVTEYDDAAYTDTKVANGKLDQAALDALKGPLQGIAKVSFFRSQPDGGPHSGKVKLELTNLAGQKSTNTTLAFRDQEKFNLALKNNGSKVVYYSLVVINPKGEMEVLLPFPEEMPQDRSLKPGASLIIDENTIEAKGFGTEYFKVVVSENPGFDLRPMFKPQAKKRGQLTSWEEAMLSIMQPEPGEIPKKRSVQVNDVTIITQSYQIVKE